MLFAAAVSQISAIGVLFPTHTAKQAPIGRVEGNEITTATMVGSEDELFCRQLREGALDILRTKFGAVPPDRHDLVVAKLRHSFDRVLKTRREIATRLPMSARSGRAAGARRGEKVEIDFR